MSSCLCDDLSDDVVLFSNSVWTVNDIYHYQKLSDLLISLAYFTIPLEIFYFVSCSSLFPYHGVLIQVTAFIILCGLTHFVTVLVNNYSPHSFSLMLTLTVLKFFTALVSCATSLTLANLIPQMLKVMVREGLLMKKTRELGEEIGLIKRQEEASWVVRMLSQEIRKSLDRHTILNTCMAELSRVLLLENCAIWLPNESNSVVVLSHELKRREGLVSVSVPVDVSEIEDILAGNGVRVLASDSRLGKVTGNGPAAATLLPMIRVSNFGGGKAVEPGYALLVLLLPEEGNRVWSSQELEIVKGVADQVAVALSHAAILEESLLVRQKLMEQNIALHRAREVTMMANEAIWSYQAVISNEIMRPNRSIAAILSVLEVEKWSEEQRKIVDTMAKVGLLLSSSIDDATTVSGSGDSTIELKSCAFSLHMMLKEVASVSKLLCAIRGLDFEFQVCGKVPGPVIGDEMRILQAVLCMVGKVLDYGQCGTVVLCVYVENGSQESTDPDSFMWKQYVYEGSVLLKFDVSRVMSREDSSSFIQKKWKECSFEKPGINFSLCEKLAKLMHGSASTGHISEDLYVTVNFIIRLPIQDSPGAFMQTRSMDPESLRCLLKGMNTILADSDSFNRSIMRKLLQNLGCHLTIVSSMHHCLETLQSSRNYYHLLLIDLGIVEEDSGELIACMKKKRSGSWLRIVALTTRPDKDMQNKYLQRVIDGVICKPIILQEMEDELQRIFHLTKDDISL